MAYEDLIKRLRCPADRAELDHVPDRLLVCRSCGRAYPIREGVPVMLVDERVQAEGQRLLEEATAQGLLGGAPEAPPEGEPDETPALAVDAARPAPAPEPEESAPAEDGP